MNSKFFKINVETTRMRDIDLYGRVTLKGGHLQRTEDTRNSKKNIPSQRKPKTTYGETQG